MLSALITTEHSYRAVPLAGQLVDQRFVHPGPLVMFYKVKPQTHADLTRNHAELLLLSSITGGIDYIFALFGKTKIRASAYYNSEIHYYLHSAYCGNPVVTGSYINSKCKY